MMGNIGIRIIILVCLAIFYSSCVVHGDDGDGKGLAKLGQFCNSTTRCKSSDFLECKFSECECQVFASNNFKTQIPSCCEREYRGGSVPGECGAYQCKGQGICKCKQGYTETANSTCAEIGGFYQPCKITTDCLQEKYGLICIENTCQCDPTVAIDNFGQIKSKSKQRQCVGLAGKDTIKGECTQDAQFKLYYPEGRVFDMICECKPPTLPDDNGLCSIVEYGGPCDLENEKYNCHPDFICRNYKCDCPYGGKHQFYDESLKQCRSFVGGPCKINGTRTDQDQCVENSKCVLNQNFGTEYAQCECEEGFVGNSEGECEYAFGSNCKMVNGTKLIKCDQLGPLFCRNGKCDCEDELQKFDHNTRKCIVLAGGVCDEKSVCVNCTDCQKKLGGILNGRGQCAFSCLPRRV